MLEEVCARSARQLPALLESLLIYPAAVFCMQLDAWFALRFRAAREYLDPLRECYEAFVIYSFLSYLITFLEDELGPEGGVQASVAYGLSMHL